MPTIVHTRTTRIDQVIILTTETSTETVDAVTSWLDRNNIPTPPSMPTAIVLVDGCWIYTTGSVDNPCRRFDGSEHPLVEPLSEDLGAVVEWWVVITADVDGDHYGLGQRKPDAIDLDAWVGIVQDRFDRRLVATLEG